MKRLVLIGGGKIGTTIFDLLHATGDYAITIADSSRETLSRFSNRGVNTCPLDVRDSAALAQVLTGFDGVVCAGPHHVTSAVITAAAKAGVAYFDLTEDVESADLAKTAAASARNVFVPQCGLAPGIVSIVAAHLARRFDGLDMVHLRVGALPQFPTNALRYNLTWSTDGLINEYCNPCRVIVDGKADDVPPLEGYEQFLLDGVSYEAFNTSGGIGTLCESLVSRVRDLNYKTVRYPGHRDLMKVLIEDLRLGERRDLLREILEHAVPLTTQDVVLIFVTVTGQRSGRFQQSSYVKKIYGTSVNGVERSAIQITTAGSACAVIDLWREGVLPGSGFVRQEDIAFEAVVANRFGRIFAENTPSSDQIAA